MSLFSPKKNSDLIATQLAKEAAIETIYANGKISGLMIFLHGNEKLMSEMINNVDSKVIFMNAIEDRIFNDDYVDTRSPEIDDLFPYKTKKGDAMTAPRAVVTDKYKPLFGWEV